MDLVYDWPMGHGPDVDVFAGGTIAEIAGVLERSGWHTLAFTEHPAPPEAWLAGGGHQSVDPFVALGHAAAVTERLRLLTYLAVAPYRNPTMLAKTAATVDVLSDGRLTVGLGTGYLKGEFKAVGADFDHRNRHMDETLEVLPLHWSGQAFSYEGSTFSCRDAIGLPAPVQQPIPIWLGGNAAITRRRVAERGQGWMPLIGPPEVLSFTRTPALEGLEELAATIVEIGSRRGGEHFDVLYPYKDPTLVEDPSADLERHRDAIGQLSDIGVTAIALSGPVTDSAAEHADWIEQVASALA